MYKYLIGKTILVRLTYVDEFNNLLEKNIIYGKIVKITSDTIDIIRSDNHQLFSLPPDMSAIKEAQKGNYFISSTGESVSNPDYLSMWTIQVNN